MLRAQHAVLQLKQQHKRHKNELSRAALRSWQLLKQTSIGAWVGGYKRVVFSPPSPYRNDVHASSDITMMSM
jgi:hypothetical protein